MKPLTTHRLRVLALVLSLAGVALVLWADAAEEAAGGVAPTFLGIHQNAIGTVVFGLGLFCYLTARRRSKHPPNGPDS